MEHGFLNERYLAFPIRSHSNDIAHPLVNFTYPLELGFYPTAKNHYKERPEGTGELILLYCLDGKGTIEEDKQFYSLSSNNLFCLSPNTPHRYYANDVEPWSILWSHFQMKNVSKYPLTKHIHHLPDRHHPSMIDSHFIELFSLCEKEYSLENAICISKSIELLIAKICFLNEKQTTDQQGLLFDKAVQFMNAHLSEPLTLSIIAQHVGISSSYLSMIFKSYHQQAPIDFLLDLRMEQACKYLRISTLKNYEIAQKVGYDDPYYFSRLFKKKIGLSPKEFRTVVQ